MIATVMQMHRYLQTRSVECSQFKKRLRSFERCGIRLRSSGTRLQTNPHLMIGMQFKREWH